MLRITHLRIRNFGGIQALDTDIPPAGGVFTGRNGSGKTSVLEAIRACLAGQGVGADAIRLDE